MKKETTAKFNLIIGVISNITALCVWFFYMMLETDTVRFLLSCSIMLMLQAILNYAAYWAKRKLK